jgi:hypothetical protein
MRTKSRKRGCAIAPLHSVPPYLIPHGVCERLDDDFEEQSEAVQEGDDQRVDLYFERERAGWSLFDPPEVR